MNESGKLSTATEEVSQPVVSGPQLPGFILANWDTVARGQTIPVRFIVFAKMQTEGRVPPMQEVAGKFEALGARVDYTMDTAAYR